MYTEQKTESGAKIHSNVKQIKIKDKFTTVIQGKLKTTVLAPELQYNYEIQLTFRRLCKSVQRYAKQGEPVIPVSSVSRKSGVFVFSLL